MKAIVAALAIALVLFPVSASAACPDINARMCCGTYWYEYAFNTSCPGTAGSVGTSTLSCWSTPAHAITGSSGSITYSYTIGASDPILNSNHWSVSLFTDFDDPNNSQYNTITATVSVTHNGVTTSNTIFQHNGSVGDLSCVRKDYWYFTAVAGDTVTVTYNGTNFNSSNTSIKLAAPILFNEF